MAKRGPKVGSTIKKTRSDLDFIKDPFQWPHLVLPMKRHTDKGLETAYMSGDGPILYHGTIYTMSPNDRQEIFASYEAILAAGWRVD